MRTKINKIKESGRILRGSSINKKEISFFNLFEGKRMEEHIQ